MTDTEINVAIAEACGKAPLYAVKKGDFYYRPQAHGYTSHLTDAWHTTKQTAEAELVSGEPMSIVPVPPPDYCADLNAMHEAETFLENEIATADQYWTLLAELTMADDEELATCTRHRYIGNATARQRAEAFLRTLGKWRD